MASTIEKPLMISKWRNPAEAFTSKKAFPTLPNQCSYPRLFLWFWLQPHLHPCWSCGSHCSRPGQRRVLLTLKNWKITLAGSAMIWSWKFCMQNLAPFEAHLFTLWGTLFHERLQRNSKKFPPGLVLDWIDGHQVWSLPSFEVSCQLLMNDLNQISSAFSLMTSSMALAY